MSGGIERAIGRTNGPLLYTSPSLYVKADAMADWAEGNGMTVSAQKSSVTLFTPWTKQVNEDLQVSIKGTPVPMEKFQ